MAEPFWIVETTYNTDPEGAVVDDDDWTNRTLHGPFTTEAEATAWMDDFLPDDTDVKEMTTCYVNPAT
jgi:hypothetical protein